MRKQLLRGSIVMDTGTTLLDYEILPDPNPLYASEDGAPDPATLTLVVSNGGRAMVTCTSITVSIMAGPNAKDLVSTTAGITTQQPGDWSIGPSGGGTFTLTPNTALAGKIGQHGVTFVFAGLAINSEVGTSIMTIDEVASTGSQPSQDRIGTIPLAKFPLQFKVSGLTAEPVEVPVGGSTVLNWNGSPASYELHFNPDGITPVTKPVCNNGPCTASNLTRTSDVIFTLVVTVTVPGQDEPLIVQRQVVVAIDTLPAVTSFSATVLDHQATFTWTSQNADSCSMSPWPNLLTTDGSLGPLAIDRMRYSMVANASGLSSTPANADLTFSIVTQAPVIFNQAWRFHRTSDGSMLVVVGTFGFGVVIAAVETPTLVVLGEPLTLGGYGFAGGVVVVTALSPVGINDVPSGGGPSLLVNPTFQNGVSIGLSTWFIRFPVYYDGSPEIALDVSEPDEMPDSATFSPDGQRVLETYSQTPFSAGVRFASVLELENSFAIPSYGPCAVSPDGTRFYVAGNKVFVIADPWTGVILGQPALGSEISNGLAMNEPGTIVYVNGANGIVSVVDTAAMQVIQQIPTGSTGAGKGTGNGIAIGPSGGEVYVADPPSNSVIVLDVTTFTVIGKIALPESPVDLVFGTGSIMQLYVLGLSGTIYLLEATG